MRNTMNLNQMISVNANFDRSGMVVYGIEHQPLRAEFDPSHGDDVSTVSVQPECQRATSRCPIGLTARLTANGPCLAILAAPASPKGAKRSWLPGLKLATRLTSRFLATGC